MDDAGKFAISLLSGHLGGANELAERCAFMVGARAVITTATDANGLPSFDMLAKEHGWVIEDISRVKLLNSLLLDDEKIAVVDGSGLVRSFFHGQGRLQFHDSFVAGLRSEAKGFLFVTNSIIPPQLRAETLLVLRPKNLVLGIGCNSGTSADEIEGVVLTMYDSRTNLSQQVVSDIRQFFKEKVFNTIIPRNVKLSEAPSFGKPISQYDRHCVGSETYEKLAEEVLNND